MWIAGAMNFCFDFGVLPTDTKKDFWVRKNRETTSTRLRRKSPCEDIDAFLSHSWHDDPEAKWEATPQLARLGPCRGTCETFFESHRCKRFQTETRQIFQQAYLVDSSMFSNLGTKCRHYRHGGHHLRLIGLLFAYTRMLEWWLNANDAKDLRTVETKQLLKRK